MFVPEPFGEATKVNASRRRRGKLAVLRPREGRSLLVIVIGEFKTSEVTPLGRWVWIGHMSDAPLPIATKAWERIERMVPALPLSSPRAMAQAPSKIRPIF